VTDQTSPAPSDNASVTPEQARQLLASVPRRPRRRLTAVDHVCAVATIALAFVAGLLALGGHPWWAVLPAIGALVISHSWLSARRDRANEPRLRATLAVSIAFTTWLSIPIWRGVTRGETIPFPEAFLFASLAPIAWLVFYLILLIRR
jgi:hypothetical protein